MSFLNTVWNKITGAGKAISAALAKVFGSEAAQKIEAAVLAVAKEELGKIAKAVVLELASSNLDSKSKQAAAFDRIKAAAVSAGIDAKDKYINYAIETAVLGLELGIGKLGQ